MSVVSKVILSLLKRNSSHRAISAFRLNYETRNSQCKLFHTNKRLEANVSFNLSDIGEGIREVVVKEWYVKEGDRVAQFDNICEVQSDKASVTITSRYDGVVTKLHVPAEQVAYVGKPLCDIDSEDAEEEESSVTSTTESAQTKSEPAKWEIRDVAAPSTDAVPEAVSVSTICIPSVRRLAKENNINLSEVSPSGKGGRILKEDIIKYLQSRDSGQTSSVPYVPLKDDRVVPVTGFQKAMLKTMTEALKIPHFVYSDEISVRNLSEVRQSVKDELGKSHIKVSYLPFFIKSASNALQRYPILNATLDENCENVTYKSAHNIAVAMDTKAGLAVPVIKNVQSLSIIDIARELNRLMASGKNGQFAPSDMIGGTFTISNIGAIGGTYTKPVILPPQVAIIAIGAIQRLPRFDKDEVVADEIVSVSGAADHRIVDGATMAHFVNVMKMQIENPNLLFLNL